jgi:osmotically-inducible protein OsmY
MARVSLSVFLLASSLAWSQYAFSQSAQPTQDPPQTPPSNSPGNAPPTQNKADVNQRIQSSIQDLLSSDPILGDVDVEASVNDESIILTGTVESYAQHQRVLQLVSSYGRWRKIVDKVKMQ